MSHASLLFVTLIAFSSGSQEIVGLSWSYAHDSGLDLWYALRRARLIASRVRSERVAIALS